jgi:penicillin-binding protein 1B
MNEFISNLKKNWNEFVDFLHKKKIIKSTRILYKVSWNLLLILIVLGILGISFAGGVGAGYFASLVKDEPIRSYESMKNDIYNYEEVTNMYFDNNVYLDKLSSNLHREEITLDQVSEYVKYAVIATEDAEFERHNGIVPKAILRAILQEALNSEVKSGGSTLTQQLIKNQILTNEVSFDRKAKEIILALRLERNFKKEQILEAYLNVVPYGRNSSGENIAGIQAAATGIFGVNASELTLPQAAYLAGLPQSPFRYTPFMQGGKIKENIDLGIARMKKVLSRMLEEGYITDEQYNSAITYDVKANLAPYKETARDRYPFLTDEIARRAVEKIAFYLAEKDEIDKQTLIEDTDLLESYKIKADREMRRSGYNIYTTIDKRIYDAMNKLTKNDDLFGSTRTIETTNEDGITEFKSAPEQVGASLINNKTGALVSFIGGRDFNIKQYNHATIADRPAGSTMKPLLAYGPAIEEGKIQPSTVLLDAPLELSYPQYEEWAPGNWNENFHGLMTAREALRMSWNIPAIKTFLMLDPIKAGEYLAKMGIPGDKDWSPGNSTFPSHAIGSMNVTVENITSAFTTFANNGNFIDAYMIERIVSKDGEIIYQHEVEEVEVFSPRTAYLTLDMLRDVMKTGTGAYIHSYIDFKADWAGKTGTSQDSRDSWIIASNPNVTLGVWIGYDDNSELDSGSSMRNQRLWASMMNTIYEINPELINKDKNFKMPGKIIRRTYCKASGLLPSDLCQELGLIDTDIFDFDNVPTEEDNSFAKGFVTYANGKTYLPNELTPLEFIEEAIYFKTELYNSEEIEYILPRDRRNDFKIYPQWKDIKAIENQPLHENGQSPVKIEGVSINEKNELTWPAHIEEDVIGYRIYRAENHSNQFKLFTNILSNKPLSFKLGNGDYGYIVTAVDINGNESVESNVVSTGNWTSEPPEITDPLDPTDSNDGESSDDPAEPNDGESSDDPADENGSGSEGSGEEDSSNGDTDVDPGTLDPGLPGSTTDPGALTD